MRHAVRTLIKNRGATLIVVLTLAVAIAATTVIYSVEHMRLPEELQKNITARYYEGGHMMYIRRADHVQLKKDLVEFIAAATGGG